MKQFILATSFIISAALVLPSIASAHDYKHQKHAKADSAVKTL